MAFANHVMVISTGGENPTHNRWKCGQQEISNPPLPDLVPCWRISFQGASDFLSYKGTRALHLIVTAHRIEGILEFADSLQVCDSPLLGGTVVGAGHEVAQCLRDNGWELASWPGGHRILKLGVCQNPEDSCI